MMKYLVALLIIGMGCSNEKRKVPVIKSVKFSIDSIEQKEVERIDAIKDDEGLVLLFADKDIEDKYLIQALLRLHVRNYSKFRTLLEKILEEESDKVKIQAISMIKVRKYTDSTKKLIKLFNESNNPNIIYPLCRTFIEFQSEEVLPSVIKKLDSKNDRIIDDCLTVLGKLGDEPEIEVLKKYSSNKNIAKVYREDGTFMYDYPSSVGSTAKHSILLIETRIKAKLK